MTLDTGITPQPPTPLLQRDLTIKDWRAVLLDFGKSLVSFACGDTAGAAANATDALGSLGLRVSPDEDAWRLIVKALNYALLDLIFQPDTNALQSDEDLEPLLDDLLRDPSIGRLRVPANFFEDPRQLVGLQGVQDAFETWLTPLVPAGVDVASLGAHLPDSFCIGVDRELCRNSKRYERLYESLRGPATAAVRLVEAWAGYRHAVGVDLNKRLKLRDDAAGDPFIPAYAECKKKLGEAVAPISVIVDVWDELVKWCRDEPKHGDWLRIVAGGIGSGRTTLAKYIVAHLSDFTNCRSLYVPLDRNEVDWTLRESIQHALEYIPFFEDQFDVLRSRQNDPLVFVLDDWPPDSPGGKFEREFLEYLNASNMGGDARRRIILMADDPVPKEVFADPQQPEVVFYLIPLLSIDYEQSVYSGRSDLLDDDRRLAWWSACVGVDFPEVLHKPPLREITVSPGMLRFIGEVYCKNPSRFCDNPRELVDRLAAFNLPAFPGLEQEPPVLVLMNLALALWQCNAPPTVGPVIAYLIRIGAFESAEIDSAEFERWTSVNPLLASRSPTGTAPAFVSEGLQDYLCARAIAVAIERISAAEMEPSQVLQQWAIFFGQAPLTCGIAEELRDLIAQQHHRDLERWHPLLTQWFVQALTDQPSVVPEGPCWTAADQAAQAANLSETLLAALNACARALRRRSTPAWPSLTAFRDWLVCLQGQRRDMDAAYRTILSRLDFAPANDEEDADGADLSCLDLTDCDLSRCNLGRTDLHLSDLTNADLSYTELVDADLSGTRMRYTNLYRAVIRGAKLDGIVIEGARDSGLDCDESFRRKLEHQASTLI